MSRLIITCLATIAGSLLVTHCCTPLPARQGPQPPKPWIALFDGKSLEGWIPKIRGYELGVNYADTFRVENGVLKVSYDGYERFGNRFGHLFYRKQAFSRYRIRVEYRFVGEQVPGGPSWAKKNSGIMLHCQPPETMTVEQSFPVSIEVQLLGGLGRGERPTANLCTPGTDVVMDGKLLKRHCIASSSPTFHGEEWVTVEAEVLGGERIRHYVNGKLVLEYESPQLDPRDRDAQRLLRMGFPKRLSRGYISLQSESHPIEFRKVELLPLD